MSESQSAENHSKSNNNFQTMDMDTQVCVAIYWNCNEWNNLSFTDDKSLAKYWHFYNSQFLYFVAFIEHNNFYLL